MTIIATYRFQDKAVFISDFRVTTRPISGSKVQADLSMKFVPIDRKIGMFLAGDVDFWKLAIAEVIKQSSDINIDNILDTLGPFNLLLNDVAIKYGRRAGQSSAIGFIVDETRHENVQFNIEIVHGNGAILTQTPNNQVTIMGSGKDVPNIKQALEHFFSDNLSRYNNDLYKIAFYFRDEVKKLLQRCGSSAYEKLGISPYMAKASLVQDSFCLHGEEMSGGHYSDRNSYDFKYSLVKEDDGCIILFDHSNNERLEVIEIMGNTPSMEAIIFDPERATTRGEDPSQLFPGRDYIYLFHQWVIPEDQTVYRSLKKIIFATDKRLCVPSDPIIGVLHLEDKKEIQRYLDCRDQYFELDPGKAALFDLCISSENLFDHELLATYITNYSTFWKSDDGRLEEYDGKPLYYK